MGRGRSRERWDRILARYSPNVTQAVGYRITACIFALRKFNQFNFYKHNMWSFFISCVNNTSEYFLTRHHLVLFSLKKEQLLSLFFFLNLFRISIIRTLATVTPSSNNSDFGFFSKTQNLKSLSKQQ